MIQKKKKGNKFSSPWNQWIRSTPEIRNQLNYIYLQSMQSFFSLSLCPLVNFWFLAGQQQSLEYKTTEAWHDTKQPWPLSLLGMGGNPCTNIKSEKKDMNLNSTSLFRSLCTTFKASTKDNEVEKILDLKEVQRFQNCCDSWTSLAKLSWVLHPRTSPCCSALDHTNKPTTVEFILVMQSAVRCG